MIATPAHLDDLERALSDLNHVAEQLERRLAACWIEALLEQLEAATQREREREVVEHSQALKVALDAVPWHVAGAVVAALSGSPLIQQAAQVLRDATRPGPYADVRIATHGATARVVNVSGTARRRGETIDQVLAQLGTEGHFVVDHEEFERRARLLIEQILSGASRLASPAHLQDILGATA